jgi:hypothetical protein
MSTSSATQVAVSAVRSRDALLRNAVRVDGVVVAALGCAAVAAAGPLARITGLPTAVEYVVGLLSVAYGPLAFWLASRPKVRSAGLVIAEINIVSAIGFAVLVMTGVAPLGSPVGELAGALAIYTAAIGAVQYVGVRRI